MRKIMLLFFLLLTISVSAQDFKPRRGGCTPDLTGDDVAASRSGSPVQRRYLPARKTDWDPNKTYKQLVILIEFSDLAFQEGRNNAYYQKVFNEPGFNERNGKGCVADYFRDQSRGKCNLEFDVFGPYQVSQKAQPYEDPNANTKNYGTASMREATQKMLAANPTLDLSVYDWNGDKTIEQIIYVYAGLTGGVNDKDCYGHIWPNTGTFSQIVTSDNYKISQYTNSAEHWPTTAKATCGIGTICHEFAHSLGLPDIYPTSSSDDYSVCDEWDLMDGGNFTNYGWCPSNFTAMERWLMGWLTFVDVDDASSITDLKPIEAGGSAYRIKHSDSEWLILENRQQTGWDAGAPGKGLVIYHVNYIASVWNNNSVNNDPQKRRFYLVPADNLNYNAWSAKIGEGSVYQNSGHMNSRILSNSPYPYIEESVVVNNSLTDTSTPAAKMFYPEGSYLNVPITNIAVNADGQIAFDIKGGTTAIQGVTVQKEGVRQLFDLSGRPVHTTTPGQLVIVKEADGTVYKYISK